jgi:hypothetical protein
MDKKEYFNRLSLERINFLFDEYTQFADDNFRPSVYFFKFLAVKPDLEKESKIKIFKTISQY